MAFYATIRNAVYSMGAHCARLQGCGPCCIGSGAISPWEEQGLCDRLGTKQGVLDTVTGQLPGLGRGCLQALFCAQGRARGEIRFRLQKQVLAICELYIRTVLTSMATCSGPLGDPTLPRDSVPGAHVYQPHMTLGIPGEQRSKGQTWASHVWGRFDPLRQEK